MSSTATAAALAKPSANEPSMEEILASIRRIIADDTLGTKQDDPPPAPPAEIAVTLEDESAATPVEINLNEEDPDADVLDLAEVATVAAKPVEIDFEIESVTVDVGADMSEPEAVPVVITPPPLPVAAVPPPPVASVAALENRILSQETGSLIGQAFQSLQRNVSVPQGRSLEDIVSEMLRPMLRGWLDEHLPGIVERLVKAEIERVARGG